MTVYLLLSLGLGGAGAFLCLRRPSRVKRAAYFLLAFFALTLVSGLRVSVGYDYDTYAAFFEDIHAQGLLAFLGENPRMEPGLFVLMAPIARFTQNPQWMFLAMAALCSGLLLLFVWRYVPPKYAWVSIYAFVGLTFFYGTMNLMRQSVAGLIALFCYPFVRDRRWAPYFALVLAAALFHRSALILIPFYWIANIPVGRASLCAYAAVGTALYFGITPLLRVVTRYVYTNYDPASSILMQPGSATYVIVPALLLGFTLLLQRPLLAADRRNAVFVHAGALTLLCYVLMTRHFLVERLALYFFLPVIWLLPHALEVMEAPLARAKRALQASRDPLKSPAYPAQKGTRPAISRAGRRLRDARINYGLTLAFVLALCLAYQLFAGQVGFHGVFPYRSVFSKVKTVQMQPVAWNNMENTTRKAGPVVLWKPGENFVYFQPQTRDGPPQF